MRSGFLLAVSLIVMSAAPASGRTSAEPPNSVQVTIAPAAVATWSEPVKITTITGVGMGRALAATSTSTKRYLHVAYTKQYRPGGAYPARYTRSGDGGATWRPSRRIGARGMSAEVIGAGASGSRVYVVWMGWRPEDNQDVGIYLRANDDHGASDAWRPRVRLTPRAVQPRQPSVAAAGRSVYVLYRAKGIQLAISRDRGRTWTTRRIAKSGDDGGLLTPRLAVSGSTVAVVWNAELRVESRVSSDGGRTFDGPTVIGKLSSRYHPATIAAARGAATVGWVDPGERSLIRNWSGGAWASPIEIPDPISGGSGGYCSPGVTVARAGPTLVGAVVCRDDVIAWQASPDEGRTWLPDEIPTVYGTSLLLRSSGAVDVVTTDEDANGDSILVYVRRTP
jgi:hypothetical protein